MLRYALRRIGISIPMLLIIIVVVFALLHSIPGNPIAQLLPDTATTAQIQAMTAHYGLNQPIPVQLGKYLVSVFQLNFGTSITYGLPVSQLIEQRLPSTVELAVAAAIVAVIVGIPLGIIAAVKRGTWIDRLMSALGLIGISTPSFWLGLLLIIYIGNVTRWFPTGGELPATLPDPGPTNFPLLDFLLHGDISAMGLTVQYLVLPAVTLGLAMAGMLVRMTRSSLLEVMGEDYVRTARAKGAHELRVTVRHSLRNALLPIVTVFGLEFATLLSGSVIVETVFAWPGIGSLLITSVTARDYPVIQGCIIVFAGIFIIVNLLVDLSYAAIDPRIRY